MDFGLRLGVRKLFHASEISYGDCADKRIVCPAWAEPVLKVGSPFTKREYLRHYPTKDRQDCKLRVYNIVKAALNPVVIVPQRQELDAYLQRFEDIVLEHSLLDTPQHRRSLRVMRSRSS